LSRPLFGTDHTIDTSPGCFVMPMVSVLFGVPFFGERTRSVQWPALGIAAVGVLVGGGVVTVVPLLLLSGAATRIPLATIGMIQYITPVLQFGIGLLVQGEPMATGRWVGFALVWIALSVLVADGVRAARRPRAGNPLTPTSSLWMGHPTPHMGHMPVCRPPVILLLGCLIPY
jgi:EamA domain-containing membrane protein RarD